ncbi:alcohol dehydrogenase catalytic domain-containing protein [Microbacterium sp. zg.Y909]|uniref:alcohol dehydrogenase catalytic domain-containing protein n=1 Tax=Microbacterium sp. zg.Y909 TaxID=2969413 RepID=UPI00214C6A89|nr:alcohol dehydrogenase catalytic domain-containing protein [Microbacterium sp. zg.Y909]MCR2826447.1 alcohol dehydrogenase catalytic domain-containing protein [Microbacterium sp. zg.Y909]
MKAWLLDEVRAELRLDEVPPPEPGPGQVLVRVKASGLCHSDVAYIEGIFPFQIPFPVILGHEAAGVIEGVGEGVTGWQIGDRVAAVATASDAPGITRDGAYSEFILLTADALVKVPEGVDWAQAAAATDAGNTAYAGVVVMGEVKPGDRVGIVGLGGLGLTGAGIALAKGASVIAVEPREEVWDTARSLGITDLVKDVSELEGMDLDLVVDFAGFSTTTAGALKAVKFRGRVVLVGLGTPEVTFSAMDLIQRAADLRGATPTGDPAHLADVISMIDSGALTIAAEAITFDEIPEGLKRLAHGGVTGRLVAVLE